MQELIFIIHILAAAFLIILILMQHGKGADMGAAFGSGASQTVFGSIGSVPFLIKVTAIVAIVFCSTCIGLSYFISKTAKPEGVSSIVSTTTTSSSKEALIPQAQKQTPGLPPVVPKNK
jgi:preprotein translocase subunit SecG